MSHEEIHIRWPGPNDPLGRLLAWEQIEALVSGKREAFSLVITTDGGEPRAFHFPAKQAAVPPARARPRRRQRERWR